MQHFTLREAQLFRLLTGFFGRDQVIPRMSAMAVCGGSLPKISHASERELINWARTNHCLFTVVNHNDDPCLVIEFFGGFEESVDNQEVEHQKHLKPLLKASGIPYITIDDYEFSEMISPDSELDLFAILKDKCGAEGIVVPGGEVRARGFVGSR